MSYSKPSRLTALDYIRGIAMLGVIGIHVGSFSLTNPDLNIELFALLEVVTRFSVPIFFFVSAFGLFYRLDISKPFSYSTFIKRRFRAVLIPYIIWTLLYRLHYSVSF
ncbi:MAG: acyltransferase family protein, partial [Selenomonadales bacterium]|nr:acyltransferase family protein [Selenomonadales bacterium]